MEWRRQAHELCRSVDIGCDESEERVFARGEVEVIKRGGEGCMRETSDEGLPRARR